MKALVKIIITILLAGLFSCEQDEPLPEEPICHKCEIDTDNKVY